MFSGRMRLQNGGDFEVQLGFAAETDRTATLLAGMPLPKSRLLFVVLRFTWLVPTLSALVVETR